MKHFIWLLLALTPLCAEAREWTDTAGNYINAHGGGILFHKGTYYWFGEHRPARGFTTEVGVTCYSSANLASWTYEGVALAVTSEEGSPIERGCIMERPKVVYCPLTGKFVMWFHLELKGQGYNAAQAAVAVSDTPTGPYTLLHNGRPCDNQMARDQTVFIDDDGTAWHIYASEDNYTLHIAELSPDFTEHTGRYVRVAPMGHNEAPTIFKHGGRYWMITSGCTGWAPNAARLLVADNILGPWEQLPNPCRGEGAETTFGAQGTYVLPTPDGRLLFMADMWKPRRLMYSGYLWLPILFEANGTPYIIVDE